jgi:hypothetical protein
MPLQAGRSQFQVESDFFASRNAGDIARSRTLRTSERHAAADSSRDTDNDVVALNSEAALMGFAVGLSSSPRPQHAGA